MTRVTVLAFYGGMLIGALILTLGVFLGHALAASRPAADTRPAAPLVDLSESPMPAGTSQPLPGSASPDPTQVLLPPAVATPRPSQAARRESVPAPTLHLGRGRTGMLAHMGSGFPDGYLAIPLGPGVRVRLCGAVCVTWTSTDAGPNHAELVAGRIADLGVGLFERICRLPASRGLCPGRWSVVVP